MSRDRQFLILIIVVVALSYVTFLEIFLGRDLRNRCNDRNNSMVQGKCLPEGDRE